MKIKFKCTPEQYGELVGIIAKLPYNQIAITNLDLINLKHFWFEGTKRMQDFHFNKKQLGKARAFTIDINHYEAIKNVLNECGGMVTQYVKSIFETIKQYAEPQILRAVSGYKLIG
jgi:hypothetical protein